MTPTPPSTTPSSGGAHSPADQFRVVRKRNRIPVSCQMCRAKKKCDRSHPCANCVKRDGVGTNSCQYAASAPRKRSQAQTATGPGDMQNRIDRLENLVLTLMHGGANVDISSSKPREPSSLGTQPSLTSKSATESSPSTRTDQVDEGSDVDDGLASSLGVLKVDTEMGKSMYLGQEHWHTLLADISEVKNYFISHKKELEKSFKKAMSSAPLPSDEPGILLGCPKASEVELRAELPPKSSIIALCDRFFNTVDSFNSIVHGPTFRQQLQAHWQDPSQTPLMWLGLLNSIMCLAALSYNKAGDEPVELKGRSLDLAAEYRLRTAQCLVTADYTKAVENTVETFVLYIFGEFSTKWDIDMGLWLAMSLATRIAFRMGYHRDGKWFKSLTPFQAEMRRRTWAVVRMCDVVFSYHLSLPRMINELDCDTELPRNILDEDFGPQSVELPPSRPANERTPSDYITSKAKLCIELGKILRATTTVGRHVSYDEIIQFDSDLRDVMARFPPHLKILSYYDTPEPAHVYINRFMLDILYQKILCVLHKSWLPRARQNTRYSHSRRSAVEASLTMLRHLETMHRETQPGCRLESLKWQVSCCALKDFTLPAALVAVELRHALTGPLEHSDHAFSQTRGFWSVERQQEMMRSLEVTRSIWQEMSTMSVDACKGAAVLKVLIESVKMPRGADAGHRPGPQGLAAPHNLIRPFDSQEMRPEQSAALGLGMLAGSISPASPAIFSHKLPPISQINLPMGAEPEPGVPQDIPFDNFGMNRPASPLSMFAQFGSNGSEITANIDWDAFENYTQTMNWSVDASSFNIFPSGEEPAQPPPNHSEHGRFSYSNGEMDR